VVYPLLQGLFKIAKISYMTKEKVAQLYETWKFHRTRFACSCRDHHPENKDVCAREKTWREYCEARDAYIGKRKEEVKSIDLYDLFGTWDGMN